ncbi:hypothetical protein WCP94_000076 (plasmid) [Bilophila wadsworthia]
MDGKRRAGTAFIRGTGGTNPVEKGVKKVWQIQSGAWAKTRFEASRPETAVAGSPRKGPFTGVRKGRIGDQEARPQRF